MITIDALKSNHLNRLEEIVWYVLSKNFGIHSTSFEYSLITSFPKNKNFILKTFVQKKISLGHVVSTRYKVSFGIKRYTLIENRLHSISRPFRCAKIVTTPLDHQNDNKHLGNPIVDDHSRIRLKLMTRRRLVQMRFS